MTFTEKALVITFYLLMLLLAFTLGRVTRPIEIQRSYSVVIGELCAGSNGRTMIAGEEDGLPYHCKEIRRATLAELSDGKEGR